MSKLIVFDLDGTLAPVGKQIPDKVVDLLKKIEDLGHRVAICSGKPVYYLCGLMRQVQLKDVILVGENGAAIQFGVALPPKKRYICPYDKSIDECLEKVKKDILKRFDGEIWFQPNDVGVTPFPKSKEEFDIIEEIIKENEDKLASVEIYRHCDSFDFVPAGINKYSGLEYLSKIIGIERKDVIAVGDGENDIPMFEFAGFSVGIGEKVKDYVDISFTSSREALEYIVEICR